MAYNSTIIPAKALKFAIPHIWTPGTNSPVTTTDEIATEIQADGIGTITGFTSLTNKLNEIEELINSKKSGTVTSVTVKMNNNVVNTITESGEIDLGTVVKSIVVNNNTCTVDNNGIVNLTITPVVKEIDSNPITVGDTTFGLNLTDGKLSLNIQGIKTSVTCTEPTPYNETYDGKSHNMATPGTITPAGAAKYLYSTDNSTWSESIPTFTNVNDSKTLYWRLSLTASESTFQLSGKTDGSISCQIIKANSSLTGASTIPSYTMESATDYKTLIDSSGTVKPTDATVYWKTTTSTTAPTATSTGWSTDASTIKPTSAGTWYVYYKITANNDNYNDKTVTKVSTTGVTVTAYTPAVDYGYYGYSTESYKAAGALTANNYIKLVSSPQEIDWLKAAYVVIATPTNVKPTYQYYSKAGNSYTDPIALFTGSKVGASDTITINDKTYYVWVSNKLTDDEDTTKLKITV